MSVADLAQLALKHSRNLTLPIKLLEQDRETHHLRVCKASEPKLQALGWTLDLSTRLAEINGVGRP